MKKVSIMVPCFNEEENVVAISEAIVAQMDALPQYDYEILFIDNCSQDQTRFLLRQICKENPKIKAIFNVRNFGQFNSPVYGLYQTTGDCTISICCDFQDPVEMIPSFLKHWEEGYQIVCAIKTSSKESRLVYRLRTLYYKMIKKFSEVDQIEHFTGFGLYDKSFLDVLRKLDDPTPFIRGIVAELGGKRKEIPYEQPKRRAGKTHNSWYTLYDAAMLSITSYTKVGMRIAALAGVAFSLLSLLIGFVYLILKLVYWDWFVAGQAPTLIIVSLFCSILLAFLGFMGEYLSAINTRVMRRPLVVEEERINFDKDEDEKSALEPGSK